LEYCKDLVKKINPVSYSFKHDLGTKRFGFIAQEVEKALDGERLGLHYRDPEGIHLQSIGYQELIAPLIKIINNLLERVEILEKNVGKH
jgi:LPS sulfotransferase NodH